MIFFEFVSLLDFNLFPLTHFFLEGLSDFSLSLQGLSVSGSFFYSTSQNQEIATRV